MRDEDVLKKEIVKLYVDNQFNKYILVGDGEVEAFADQVLALFASEFEKAKKYDELLLIKDPVQVERELFKELVRKADQWDALGYVTAYVEPENYDKIKEKAEKWDKIVETESYTNMASCTGCPLENAKYCGTICVVIKDITVALKGDNW